MTVTAAWVGRVTPSSAWVRAKVSGSSVELVVSEADDLSNPTAFGPATPDGDGLVDIEATGLDADTQYWWGLEVDSSVDTSMTGKFRTFPTAGQPATFTFGTASCAGQTGSAWASDGVSDHPVFDDIRADDPLFFIHTGDLHYRDIQDDDQAAYHQAYDDVLGTARQGKCWREVPVVYVWDNHDNQNPSAPGGVSPAALPVYKARVPHYPLPAADAIYQKFSVGRVLFLITDLYSHRSSPTTMLGAAQKQWLKDEMLGATEQLIVWVSTMPWISHEWAGRWNAFPDERDELADFFVANDLHRKMLIVSGDDHMLAIDDGRNNVWGGCHIPVLQAAAMDCPGTLNTGPYSHGAYAGGGQYGLVTVTDDGVNPIEVTLTGRKWSP